MVDVAAIGEHLAALDDNPAAVTVGDDTVGGPRPAEVDYVTGVDALRAASGVDVAAVDRDGAGGVDAVFAAVGGDVDAVDLDVSVGREAADTAIEV